MGMDPLRTTVKSAIVVGAGPAGASAGLALLRAGWSVKILEQQRTWQGRVCGCFLSPEAVDHLNWLGLLPQVKAKAVEVSKAILTTTKTSQTLEFYPARPGLGLPRQHLEEILLQAVKESGGQIERGTRVLSVQHQGLGGSLQVQGPKPLTLSSQLLVLAPPSCVACCITAPKAGALPQPW